MKQKYLVLMLLLIPLASAMDSNYDIIIEENGNGLVVIGLEGQGLITVPLQSDVTDIKVRGALYTINGNSVDISIGSTESAVVLYKTSFLTTKQQGTWNFNTNLIGTENEVINLYLPLNAIIINTEPQAQIELTNYTKITWNGDLESIEAEYKFPEINIDQEETNNKIKLGWIILIIIIIVFIIITTLIFLPKKKKEAEKKIEVHKEKKSNKENIIKTLSNNESLIVNIMLEHKGEIKRNNLEKESKLAKSSLANTLNNLERKNIVEINKDYTTHFVKFTRWFNEL